MPKSLLILIVASIAGLSVLTWSQFFREPPEAPPIISGGAGGKGAPEVPGKGQVEPSIPVEIPRDVPLAVAASKLMQALVEAMLGVGDPLSHDDLAWLSATEEGVAELMRLLETSEDDNLKAAVLITLGKSRLGGTLATLEEAAGGRYGDTLRTAGIVAMINGQDGSIRVLRKVLDGTRDEGVAAASLQVLAHQDYDRALLTFADLLAVTQAEVRRDTLYQILGGQSCPLETDEPEVMARFRSGLHGLIPPEPEPNPEQSKVIDNIVDQIVRDTDPRVTTLATMVLVRMPGQKAEDAFIARYKAADTGFQFEMVGMLHPDSSRGKIGAFLRLAPGMADRRQRDILSARVAEWRDSRIVDEVRVWRDREEDQEIRQRLDETIRRMEGR